MCDPQSNLAVRTVPILESSFQKSIELSCVPLMPFDFDFKGKKLPAYITFPFNNEKALYIVIGGGDTFREDLYYLGGKYALGKGLNVLMVDLPGQGKTPYDGLHFSEDTVIALEEIIREIRGWVLKTRSYSPDTAEADILRRWPFQGVFRWMHGSQVLRFTICTNYAGRICRLFWPKIQPDGSQRQC